MNTNAQQMSVDAPLARDLDQDIRRIEEEAPVDTSTAGPTTLHMHHRELAKDPTKPVKTDGSAPPESNLDEDQHDKQISSESPVKVNENSKAPSASVSSPMTGIAHKSFTAITDREGSKSHNQASTRFKLPLHPGIGSGSELKSTESKESDVEESKAVVSSEKGEDLATRIEIDERKEKKSKTEKKSAKTKAKKSNLRKGKWTVRTLLKGFNDIDSSHHYSHLDMTSNCRERKNSTQ